MALKTSVSLTHVYEMLCSIRLGITSVNMQTASFERPVTLVREAATITISKKKSSFSQFHRNQWSGCLLGHGDVSLMPGITLGFFKMHTAYVMSAKNFEKQNRFCITYRTHLNHVISTHFTNLCPALTSVLEFTTSPVSKVLVLA